MRFENRNVSAPAYARFFLAINVFLASFLLFVVEPVAAKQLLPAFGGSAAVWITCLVFFQAALLCAYLYAHWLTLHKRLAAHLALLTGAASAAILGRSASFSAGTPLQTFIGIAHPVLAIFAMLAVSIGLPFLMLGATSPLLQVWWSHDNSSPVPYRLYALSNLASLLALALYPTVIEPNLTLRQQWLGWSIGFAVFVMLSVLLTWQARSVKKRVQSISSGSEVALAPLRHRLLWILLPMAAAIQLSAVTAHLTQNIAAIPLLWVLPLAVYLITLILAFQFPGLPQGLTTRLLVVMLGGLGFMLSKVEVSFPLSISLGFFLFELFIACYFCHSEAYALRPHRSGEVTLFYLLFAAGGALGSFLVGVAAPMIFSFNYDLALAFFVTAAVVLAVVWPTGWGPRILWMTTTALMLVLVFFLRTAFERDTQIAVRNFYGSLRVKQTIGYPPAVVRTLSNGTIRHGSQIFSTELMMTPTTYYARDSGVGLALRFCCPGRTRNIGVVGLGVGTIAAYGQAGDRITFYEINSAVIPIARNVFAYMRNSPAQIDIVEGDARTSLAHESPQKFDVLVIDAFSGDAIPLHLLTSEAVTLYKRHLAPGGVLAFHISNQHVDLEPEIALLAQNAGMQSRRVSSPTNEQRGEFSATWMLVSDDSAFFQIPAIAGAARQPSLNTEVRLWTDDYSSLWPILR